MTRQKRSVSDWADDRERLMTDPAFASAFRARYPYAEVANAILALRTSQGLTQQELAEAAETTQSVIARLESGRHPIGTKFLTQVAEAVGMVWRPVFEPAQGEGSGAAPEATDNVVSLFGTRPSPPAVEWRPEAVQVRAAADAEVAEALDAIQSRIEHVRDMFERTPRHRGRSARQTHHADVG